ncbi:MAG: hypothetical protein JWN86_2811 [Planctomycetota bacterium]|nr:hypothetical protein [Planctomycetota bacterium]
MTAKLLPRFKQSIRHYTMIPSKGGCFELRVGKTLLYSKLATGRFPDEEAMIEAVSKALKA